LVTFSPFTALVREFTWLYDKFFFLDRLSTSDFYHLPMFSSPGSPANIIVMTVGGNEKYYSWTSSDGQMVDQSRLPSEAARKSIASFDIFVSCDLCDYYHVEVISPCAFKFLSYLVQTDQVFLRGWSTY
jgi:hypothetical protein